MLAQRCHNLTVVTSSACGTLWVRKSSESVLNRLIMRKLQTFQTRFGLRFHLCAGNLLQCTRILERYRESGILQTASSCGDTYFGEDVLMAKNSNEISFQNRYPMKNSSQY
ncbi:hypothetical protein TNCT_602231 [Trichonephila clavata]|uniref:Uncharacterized protein n=1 Tax=Trichonephila clavata TaxID=2740835 RepID=A0A8X6KAQ6_TRICU|nr:hypothetical protein TNCT_602231 [Trichonephila clavata]